MKCYGKFRYRGLTKKDAGEFVNGRGENVKYNASYEIKVDEVTNDGTYERKFKTPIDSPLLPELAKLELYQEFNMEFEVVMFGTNVRLIPVAVNNNSK